MKLSPTHTHTFILRSNSVGEQSSYTLSLYLFALLQWYIYFLTCLRFECWGKGKNTMQRFEKCDENTRQRNENVALYYQYCIWVSPEKLHMRFYYPLVKVFCWNLQCELLFILRPAWHTSRVKLVPIFCHCSSFPHVCPGFALRLCLCLPVRLQTHGVYFTQME